MSPFNQPLDLRYIDGRQWQVLQQFVYEDTRYTRVFVVPAGFITDFASVPRMFWRLLPPTGRYGKAAVIHDRLYRTGSVARCDADDVFYRAMRDLGVHIVTRSVMWVAVRLFGGFAYKGQH